MNTETGNAFVYTVSYSSNTCKLSINLTLPDTFKLISIYMRLATACGIPLSYVISLMEGNLFIPMEAIGSVLIIMGFFIFVLVQTKNDILSHKSSKDSERNVLLAD